MGPKNGNADSGAFLILESDFGAMTSRCLAAVDLWRHRRIPRRNKTSATIVGVRDISRCAWGFPYVPDASPTSPILGHFGASLVVHGV